MGTVPRGETVNRRAWEDLGHALGSLRYAYIIGGIGVAAITAVATVLSVRAEWSDEGQIWIGLVTFVAALLGFALLSYGWFWVLAPYRQRNEARAILAATVNQIPANRVALIRVFSQLGYAAGRYVDALQRISITDGFSVLEADWDDMHRTRDDAKREYDDANAKVEEESWVAGANFVYWSSWAREAMRMAVMDAEMTIFPDRVSGHKAFGAAKKTIEGVMAGVAKNIDSGAAYGRKVY